MSNSKMLYLDLLKRTLINWHYADSAVEDVPNWSLVRKILGKYLSKQNQKICRASPIPDEQMTDGKGMHTSAYTLVGLKRLENVQNCIIDVIENNVPGDLLEAGVWRGGTCIFMRGVLKAFDVTDRRVWVADSFQGLPEPDIEKYPEDAGEWLHNAKELAVSKDKVKANFERFEMLDDQVRFIEGFFRDSLSTGPVEKLALLRLDGDMYESTIDTLNYLYPKLSIGGYLIVDDFQRENCKKAVIDYRRAQGIDDPIREIDWISAYWQKTK